MGEGECSEETFHNEATPWPTQVLKDCTDIGATKNPFCVFMTTGVPWFLGNLHPSVSHIHTTY